MTNRISCFLLNSLKTLLIGKELIEFAVKINKSQKLFNLFRRFENFPFDYNFNFCWVHNYFLFTAMMKPKYFVVFISNSQFLTFNCRPVCYDLRPNKKLSRRRLPKGCFGDVPGRAYSQIWQYILGYWDVWDVGNVSTFRTSHFIYIYIVISQINSFFLLLIHSFIEYLT